MDEALLRRFDIELGGGPRVWSDVVVMRNVGPLHTSTPLPGDNISNRGFNAVLLNAGRPTHFLKLRPVEHRGFQREAEMAIRVSRHSSCGHIVPHAVAFEDGAVRVLAEEFVAGDGLAVVIRSRPASWPSVATELLNSVLPPLASAISEITGCAPDCALDANVLSEDLALLKSLGLGGDAARGLAFHLDSGSIPARPQHGDFWPRNVLKMETRLTVLDFESCGEVFPAMYDEFHMIRGCVEAACGGTEHWIEQWERSGSGALSIAALAASPGLDPLAVERALVAYLVQFVARLYRRGNAKERLNRRIQELDALPDLLARGVLRRILRRAGA